MQRNCIKSGKKTNMFLKKFFVLAGLCGILAACGGPLNQGGNADSATAGDATAGEVLFKQGTIHSAPGCIICHSIEPGEGKAGPSLAGIGSSAGKRVKGQTAKEYLYASIIDPNAYIVQGFPSGIMYPNFKDVLSGKQVNDLVAYLLTLK
jgi:mono/diheme cytochrome c family protein